MSPLPRLCVVFRVGALSILTLIEINGYSYNWRIMRVSEFRHVEDEDVVRLLTKAPQAGSLSARFELFGIAVPERQRQRRLAASIPAMKQRGFKDASCNTPTGYAPESRRLSL